jgi:hypothetical protein
MFTCCTIAAPRRHPQGEPRSPSPTNQSLAAAPICFFATGQPTHSRRPLTSASPFPPRPPFVAPGGVGGLGDLDVRSASFHSPAHVITTPGRLVVAPGTVQTDRRDQSASLQVACHKQLRDCVAKSEFRDKWPVATEFAHLFTAHWPVTQTNSARVGQQMRLATLAATANMAGSQKPALFSHPPPPRKQKPPRNPESATFHDSPVTGHH